MKIFSYLLLTICTTSLFASVSLHNADGTKYDLYVDHGSSAVHTSINGNTTTSICSKDCKIKLKSNGASIEAKDGDKIEIKDGALSKK
ncbi:hypothetical protein JXR93_04255 [bacterium]|nr:hypothetical protein [bacterium]